MCLVFGVIRFDLFDLVRTISHQMDKPPHPVNDYSSFVLNITGAP
jgi:hypothetical protein